ncbi:MAG: AMP-binding protein [Rubrivivax sp.]|nr:AMP-binding protein [Rubrivivax sp.]
MEKPWLNHYPAGVPAELDTQGFRSLSAVFDDSFARHAPRAAMHFMGRDISYAQLDADSRALAVWLLAQGLEHGDRVAIMMPNVPQVPVAVVAVLRAGLVVVNVDPLYTSHELEHRLRDSGAKAIVILENFAATLEQVLPRVPTKTVLLASLGDMLSAVKGALVNQVQRRVRHRVPVFQLPDATRFNQALADGRRTRVQPPTPGPDDIAVLQYTGGTTGASKGAVLLHRNLVANLLQAELWHQPVLVELAPDETFVSVCALPLHHIFAFTTCMLLSIRIGGCMLLIPDAHDLDALLKTLASHRFHAFPATDTLFQALAQHPDFGKLDFSALKLCVGGGMAVRSANARLWLGKAGRPIVEAYGLTETSALATCNPVDDTHFTGSIGLPLPGTELALLDDNGATVPPGMPGEIAIRGPQVMAGYWQRPDETAKVMTADGFFRTGDIGTVDSRGYFGIIDRKKDLILVSGFNVFPNEVEDVITQMPGVLECATVGMPDAKAGEAVKVLVVKGDPAITEQDIRAFCEANLAGYKRPKVVEFRTQLPKSRLGRILRRELRDFA